MISYVYPVHDRWTLLQGTLASLQDQDPPLPPYEIVVIDDGSGRPMAPELFHGFEALPLRGLRLTPVASSAYCLPDGGHNPCRAWNVGIQQARGAWVALSSPEVIHRQRTTLATLDRWVTACGERTAVVADVYDETWLDTEFHGWVGGGAAERPLNFLAVYPKADLLAMGGFEEDFLLGFAFEDNEFAERWVRNGGGHCFTHEAVTAEHLPHMRPPEASVGLGISINAARRQRSIDEHTLVANVGRAWGVGIEADIHTAGWLAAMAGCPL